MQQPTPLSMHQRMCMCIHMHVPYMHKEVKLSWQPSELQCCHSVFQGVLSKIKRRTCIVPYAALRSEDGPCGALGARCKTCVKSWQNIRREAAKQRKSKDFGLRAVTQFLYIFFRVPLPSLARCICVHMRMLQRCRLRVLVPGCGLRYGLLPNMVIVEMRGGARVYELC